ncbi:MAG: helix-turn-helix domain-containing protein [Chloroflexota bacterium]|nr:helix-turn-helix domain-containing protein [Chloroflexota bacterium]MDP9469547.1 helix-turn-helix domain-containing protein [Chloroflexota bacterium]
MRTLREWRRERLLSLADLADKAGITEKTIGEIERGRARPQLRTMRKITEVLGVEPKDVAEFAAAIAATDADSTSAP